MKDLLNGAITNPTRPIVTRETPEGFGPGRLEVNVVFTDPQSTVAALKTARTFARDLGVCIRVRAALAVPYTLPLDSPLVSTDFVEELLSGLISRMDLDAFEPSVHLYLCRNRVESLLRVLSPNSLVVMGGRKRWWPTAERRMAQALRSNGHRVVFIGLKSETKWSPQ